MDVAKHNSCDIISVMKYIDAHCHFLGCVLPDGVVAAITNATCPDDWDMVAKMSGQGGIFGAIGIHPWYVSDLPTNWMGRMRACLTAIPGLMIGEIGLDKHRPDMATQIDVFTTQMQMAVEFGRVAHIHCIGAWDTVLTVLSKFSPPAIVFHDFSASSEIMHTLVKYNAYFSFGRAICDPRRQRAKTVLCATPKNRILSESDTDNPANVIPVVTKMSEIMACPLADVTETIYNNAMELLKNG